MLMSFPHKNPFLFYKNYTHVVRVIELHRLKRWLTGECPYSDCKVK
jgi:hypothetical protein